MEGSLNTAGLSLACARPFCQRTILPLRLFQQRLSLLWRESLDRVSQRRSGDFGAMFEQKALEPCGIGLSGLAQHPARGFVNKVFGIFEQRLGDRVSVVQLLASPRGMNYAYGRRPAQP